jgi:DNA replication and repair protein RecF
LADEVLISAQVVKNDMLKKVGLTNFRNYDNKIFEFSPKITVVVGPNASGKTNMLESLHLLATGKSFKATIEEEMINHEEEITRVKGKLHDEMILEVVLTRGEINIGTTRVEKVARKKLSINKVGKRLVDFAGNFTVVVFGPEDLELVIESPSIRRKFLDSVLSQTDREYRRASLSYEKGLSQRNKLLYRIREEGLSRSQLLFWDRLLIKNGDYLSKKRGEFIEFINNTDPLNEQQFSLEYDKSAISEARLEQYAREEVAAATTLVGPHRDDFAFKLGYKKKRKRDLAKYRSRGEQRMGVLWLKLAELSYIKSTSDEKPTLLLDDIFSELDNEHRKIVLEVAKGQQTVITTADEHTIANTEKVEIIKLKG